MKTRSFDFSPAIESVDSLASILKTQSTFYHRTKRNADGTPMRWRTNGMLKRWKRDINRMRLPIKHGLYDTDAIESLDEFNTYLAIGYTER